MTEISDRIKIIQMDGEPKCEGREDVVKSISDPSQFHDISSGCALISGTDQFEFVQRGDSL